MVKNEWQEDGKVLGDIYTEKYAPNSTIVLKNCICGTIGVHTHASTLMLSNCVVTGALQIGSVDFDEILIENCVVDKLWGMMARFNGLCTIKNSVFISDFCLHASGYNKKEMRIEGNVFRCFAEFSDSVFENRFIMTNNLFVDACDILGGKGTSVEVVFKNDYRIEHNIGSVYFDSVAKS